MFKRLMWLFAPLMLIGSMGITSGGFPPLYPGAQINARAFGVKCDGASDDFAAFTAAIAAVPTGGSLYIPPSATMCELSAAIVINKAMAVYTPIGGAYLQAKTGNVSTPVLLDVTASNVTVTGLGFDGGGNAFANTGVVVRDNAGANNVLFTQIAVQHTRGVGLSFLTVTNSGVTYSSFNDIGMLWVTSLLAADRHQAIVFTNATAIKNYAIGNYFKNIGLDAISGTGQTGWIVADNRCDLSTAQVAQAFGNWPACIFGGNNTGVTIVGNVSDSAPGNGIDMSSPTTGVDITGNYVTGSGGSGISLAGVTNFTVNGNTLVSNGVNTTSCNRSGVDFLDAVTRGTVSGNVATSNATFGMFAFTACSHVATLTNVSLDTNNVTVGNTSGAYGGGISAPSTMAAAFFSVAGSCVIQGGVIHMNVSLCVRASAGVNNITLAGTTFSSLPVCVATIGGTLTTATSISVNVTSSTAVTVETGLSGVATDENFYLVCNGF